MKQGLMSCGAVVKQGLMLCGAVVLHGLDQGDHGLLGCPLAPVLWLALGLAQLLAMKMSVHPMKS